MRTSLSRFLPRRRTDDAALAAMRRKAWLEQGVATFRLEDLSDDWARAVVTGEAERLYGKRAAA